MGEEDSGLRPIPIIGHKKEQEVTAEEWLAYRKQQHEHAMQWGFLTILGLVVLGFLTPLILWLSRTALGG